MADETGSTGRDQRSHPSPTDAPAPEPEPQVEPTIARHAAPQGRRRWPWIVLGELSPPSSCSSVGAALWYFSGLIGDGCPHPAAGCRLPDEHHRGRRRPGVVLRASPSGWTDQGLTAIATERGRLRADRPTRPCREPTRQPAVTTGCCRRSPPRDRRRRWTAGTSRATRRSGSGCASRTSTYDSPARSHAGLVHPRHLLDLGRGRARTVGHARRRGLRIASTVAPLGYPMLLIKYRNDAQAPGGQRLRAVRRRRVAGRRGGRAVRARQRRRARRARRGEHGRRPSSLALPAELRPRRPRGRAASSMRR